MLLLDSDKFFAHALSLQSATGGSVYVLDETGAAVYQTPDAPGLPAGAACAGQQPCWRLYACWAAQQRWQRPDCSA